MLAFSPSEETFRTNWEAGRNQILSLRMVSDTETPVSAMQKLGRGRKNCFLLESIEGGAVRGRYSIIGRDPDLIWKCVNGQALINRAAIGGGSEFSASPDNPLDDLRNLLAECKMEASDLSEPMSAGLFGYLGYDMVRHMEKLPKSAADPLNAPEAILLRPSLLAIFDQIDNIFTLVAPAWYSAQSTWKQAYHAAELRLTTALDDLRTATAPNMRAEIAQDKSGPMIAAQGNMSPESYVAMVEKAKDYIRAGDIFQVVLSQRFAVPFQAEPFELYRTVRRQDPSPFLFYFNLDELSIVGSSPEILVRVRDKTITIRPIAGTRPRGQGNRTDAELEEELLADSKELAEHLMLVDLGRNDVGRFAKIGSVKVTARNTIERYKHVMHIVSNVEGELDDQYTPLEALMGGFPAGTVSGAPKIRAMEIIAELENDKRGVYAGCVGYFGSNGTLDTCIAIRTAVIKDGTAYVQAGAGIVYDSDAWSEQRECQAKARGMLHAIHTTLRTAQSK